MNTLTTNAPVATSLDSARCASIPPQGAPAVLLSKTTLGQAGGPFSFVLDNTVQTSGTVSTATAGTAVQIDGDTSTAGLQSFTVANINVGNPLTINESALPAGWSLTAASCSREGATVGSLSGTTYTVPGAAVASGALIECNFVNTRLPVLRLRCVQPLCRWPH